MKRTPLDSTRRFRLRWNPFDLFLVLLMILAGLTLYFNFVKPIRFSHLIKREGVMRYAEVDILLPDDLYWMREVLPLGEEFRTVYGDLEWKILQIGEETFPGKKMVRIKAKLLVTEESSGLVRYGKYTLVKGGKINLINDHYFLEGRVLDFKFLQERISL
jgi:hypothetical protein